MATIAPQNISRAGVGPTYSAAAGGGDSFLPGSDTFVHVKNGSGAPITVTLVTPGFVAGDIPIADPTVSVPAGGERMIGPFPPGYFADPADGLADLTYSGVTSLTLAVLKLTQP